MPINYSLYHPDWKTVIRPAILERDNHACKFCGVKNYEVGYRDKTGKFWTGGECLNLLEDNGYDIFAHELSHIPGDKQPTRIVLTIAHLDHNINNNDYNNLAALCQKCHLNYDRGQRGRKGQMKLL